MKRHIFKILAILFFTLSCFEACIPTLGRSALEAISALLRFGSSGNYKIRPTVSGLVGSGLVIQLNGTLETLGVGENGKISFSNTLTSGSEFTVTVQTQPTSPNQICIVTGGTGTVGSSDVESILINCDSERYALSGTVAGKDAASTDLVLENTIDGSTVNISGSGSFSFTTTYTEGSTYNIAVQTAPNNPLQSCSITNGSGTFTAAAVTNITINCTTLAYPINVQVVGLSPTAGAFRIQNNANEILNINANGTYTFPTNIPTGDRYSLRITQTPASHSCVYDSTGPNPDTGIIAASGVTVRYNCFTLILADSTPKTGSILRADQSLLLVFTSPVDVNSCLGSTGTFGGTPTGLPEFAVTSTNFPNDTLVVSPDSGTSSSWLTGFRTLTLNCTTTAGGYPLSTTTTLLYNIPSSIRYVSASGNDANPGTNPSLPLQNISAAFTNMGACPTADCAILVEEGTYESNGAGPNEIILVGNGVSLYGGYRSGSLFGVRDPALYPTRIQMTTPPAACAAPTVTSPCSIIYVNTGVTVPTFIGGLRIIGFEGVRDHTAGIFVAGSNSIYIIDNEVSGGKGTISASGVSTFNASPILALNTVTGGECSSNNCVTTAIRVSGTIPMAPNFKLNTIFKGGTCSFSGCISSGMFVTGTGNVNVGEIQGNYFQGGNVDPLAFGSRSAGYYHESGNSGGALWGNLLFGGDGAQTSGIRIVPTTNMSIGSLTQGNILGTGTASSLTATVHLEVGHTVTNNEIRLGTVNGATSTGNFGVYVVSTTQNIDITRNVIIDGTSSAGTFAEMYGIFAFGLTAPSTIQSNFIRMGTITAGSTASENAGIKLNSANAMSVRNNLIIGGTSTGRVSAVSFQNTNSSLLFYHNTMNSGTTSVAGDAHVVRLTTGSGNMNIQNNILMLNNNLGGNTCIFKNSTVVFGTIVNNDLYNCTNLVYDSMPAINYTTLCNTGVPGIPGCGSFMGSDAQFGSNITDNPNLTVNFGSTSNFVPTTNTPCAVSQTTNGLITNSITGAGTRPGSNATHSMGAYEYDGVCQP